MSNTINEAFENVSLAVDNVKSNLATAITAKGIQTNSTDTFAKMTENVGKITGGTGDKKYGVGDFIDVENLSVEKKIQNKWEKSFNRQINGVCEHNGFTYFIVNEDLIKVDTKTGNEITRKLGYGGSPIRMQIKNNFLYLQTEEMIIKLTLEELDIVKAKTYNRYFNDFFVDGDFIFATCSDISLHKIDDSTFEIVSSTTNFDNSYNQDAQTEGFTCGDNYIYISYTEDSYRKVIRFKKDDLSHEIYDASATVLAVDGSGNTYTKVSSTLYKTTENLGTIAQTSNTYLYSIEDIKIKGDKVFLYYEDKIVCLNKDNFELIYKVDLGVSPISKLYHFPSSNENVCFCTTTNDGIRNLYSKELSDKSFYKVLR